MLKKWLLIITGVIIAVSLFGCGSPETAVAARTESKSGWTLFSSGSEINMLITKGDEVWAATAGGVEMWNRKTGACRLYTIVDGILDSYVYGITQDNSGVIWAVTNFNAYFFNGTGWTVSQAEADMISVLIYDHPGNDWVTSAAPLIRVYSRYPQLFSPAADTLPSDINLNSILEDKKGNLWANLSGHGLAYYNGQSWQTFTTADGLVSNRIETIFTDNQNNLWCAAAQGVSRYDGTHWQNFSSAETGFAGYGMTISQDSKGNLWFGLNDSTDHLFYRYNGNNWDKFSTDGLTNPQHISVDNDGILWCTKANGLSRYDGNAWRTFSAADGFTGFFTSTLTDQDGNLWFGTDSAIKHYDGTVWQTLLTPGGPNDNQIRDMFMDRDGNMWFGTNGGISYYNGKTWKTFTQPDGLSASCSPFFQDNRGNIWWATPTGINRFDGKSVRKFDAEDGIDMDYFFAVSAIVQDNQGNLWFGTLYSKPMSLLLPGENYDPDINKQPEGGIYRYDGKTWQKFTTKDGLAGTGVQSITKDNQGNLWFTTYQSVTMFNGTDWKTFTQTDGIAGASINSIFKDKADNIWVITDSGLNRYDGKSWQSFELPAMNNVGKLLSENGYGLLCFGGNLIYRFDGQTWRPIDFGIDQPKMSFYTVTVSQDDNLWLGTNQGLISYDGSKLRTFFIMDDLQFKTISTILIDRGGDIWCGTAYGLARYNPNHK
jgi:ligand-binding sensor domain-containing protein